MPNIPSENCTASTVTRDGRELITFGGCNYLGLAHHSQVLEAARDAVNIYGLSSSASRETTGNAKPHAMLEDQLTRFCEHQSGLLVPDGYTANLAALQGLEVLGVKHAIIDSRAHASLKDAARLAGMDIHLFDHLDHAHARSIIDRIDDGVVILTDSVFTTDGDLAPSNELLALVREQDWLLLDDCHGFGVLGDHGRGTPNELGVRSDRLIVTTTLAKGLGCAGGIVMGSSESIESARSHSIAYRCTTPASPALVSAGIKALDLLQHDETIHASLRTNIDHVRDVLRANGIETHDLMTPIFAFTIGDETNMRSIEKSLLELGFVVPLMDYPNGPAPMYFRLAINAGHRTDQIDQFGKALEQTLRTHQTRMSVCDD